MMGNGVKKYSNTSCPLFHPPIAFHFPALEFSLIIALIAKFARVVNVVITILQTKLEIFV